MKKLEEYNEEVRRTIKTGNVGVACDLCSTEMYEEYPGMLLCSYPGYKNVKCPNCGYSGLMCVKP